MYTECCHAICERGENVKLDMCTVNTIIVTVCKFKMPKHEPITHVSPKKKPTPIYYGALHFTEVKNATFIIYMHLPCMI